MLQWNELRITPDGKLLIVDVEVQHLDYYKNVGIESIYINAYKTIEDFKEAIPDDSSILVWTTEDASVTHIRKYIDIDTISDKLLFVYAVANGTPTEDTPCGAKDKLLVGVVYNKAILYHNSITTISTLNDCTPSKDLIDYILNVKAFELSLEVGDYKSAISYWNKTFGKQVITKTKCGCHGY